MSRQLSILETTLSGMPRISRCCVTRKRQQTTSLPGSLILRRQDERHGDSANDFSSNMYMKEAQRKRFLCGFMLNYMQTKLSFRHDRQSNRTRSTKLYSKLTVGKYWFTTVNDSNFSTADKHIACNRSLSNIVKLEFEYYSK